MLEPNFIANREPALDRPQERKKVQGYLITTKEGAEVYVPIDSAPELEAAYSARNKFFDKFLHSSEGRISDNAYRRTVADLTDKIQTAANAHLYYGVTHWVREVEDGSAINPHEMAPAKSAGPAGAGRPESPAARADPLVIRKGDAVYRKVRWATGHLYNVGVLADGSLFNPHGYPEADVRVAIKDAQERRHQRRSKSAKAAAETRNHRQELRVLETAKRIFAGHGIGQRKHCYICGKGLSDPESIQRGIGPECWQEILTNMERVRAERLINQGSNPEGGPR
jgi:hypothetical protein